ncbi:hypothetical protein LNQ49_22240 [Flavobacterium sp. F-65]|jgi:hypothetical protein|uniref:Uncharacterized protein n=1 Tax=Flavobacterium pisciphilum TaxID=2893755 RepID=A0ABS8MZX4_9FLAO|nr:hypothetical protein [Flavobacterium sp. F-65]MCC9074317.1 hypothetical protein [Flavobacterium sp. F-65]
MKKRITLIAILFVTSYAFSQQIGDEGYAPIIKDFTIPLKSGVYSGLNATGETPDSSHDWSHLFVVRHTNQTNNYQLQIASSYTENDRLFFRKIAYNWGLSPKNTAWFELATRGTNNFKGNQIINGNVGIGNSEPEVPLSVYGISNFYPRRIGDGDARQFSINYSLKNLDFINNLYPIILGTGGGNQPLILDAARVGIGTANPDAKLAVNGTIHSQEVKVDMLGWSDFVFKKEYNLPTLAEVEKHIKENGHLENIPNEEEVLKNGINLGEMNAKLLQKIEELTLYMIEMKKENFEMKKRLIKLENK